MSSKFEQTTRQLLEIDPTAELEIDLAITFRKARPSLPVRLGLLTMLLSGILLVSIRPYQWSDLLIVLAGGYVLATNITIIQRGFQRLSNATT